jgi:hypothetical protein
MLNSSFYLSPEWLFLARYAKAGETTNTISNNAARAIRAVNHCSFRVKRSCLSNNLPDDQPGLRRLNENGRGPWFARSDAFPILYQAAVDRQRERNQRQEQQRNMF